MHTKKTDMTCGSILTRTLLFALPICLSNILQQLYSTADTFVIGNYCSSISLAAVGTASQPVDLLLCLFFGIGGGVSILVSQYVGGQDFDSLKKTVSTATFFLYGCAIPLTVLGIAAGPLILKWMQVPEDTMEYASVYMRIVFLATLGNMGYNLKAGILRGMGDSRSSLLFLIISCSVNIVLDLLFVVVFHMDVAGAALATAIAMFASWIFSIAYIIKKYPELEFTILPRRFDRHSMAEIIRIGLPLGLNNSIYSVGHIMMQSLVNLQGSAFMASCTLVNRVTGIANVSINALGSAATTFAGQNLGARQIPRLKKGGRQIPLVAGLITCAVGLLVTGFARPLFSLFTEDSQVLDLAVLNTCITMPTMWLFAVFSTIVSFANGIGVIRFPTVINVLMLWAVRIPAALLIAHVIGGIYIPLSYPISYLFGLAAILTFYRSKQWKEI